MLQMNIIHNCRNIFKLTTFLLEFLAGDMIHRWSVKDVVEMFGAYCKSQLLIIPHTTTQFIGKL